MPHERADVLAVCESRRQVDWLVRRPSLLGKTGRFVAASPDAAWALEKRGLPFIRLEDHDERKSEHDVEDLIRRQIEWAQWVDAFLQAQIPEFKGANFRPARTYLLCLKNLWDTCIHRASMLQALAISAQPAEVVFFANPQPIRYGDRLSMQASVLAESIPLWAEHAGITLTALPAITGDALWEYEYTHIGRGIRRVLSKCLESARRQYQSGRGQAARLRGLFATGDTPPGDSGPCILLKRGHDLTAEVVERLRARRVRVLESEQLLSCSDRLAPLAPVSPSAFVEAWDSITSLDEFWRPGGWQDWSLRPVLEPAFRHFWFTIIPALWQSTRRLSEIIEKRQVRAIVLATVSGVDDFGLVMAAHACHIPVLMYLHGVSVGDLRIPIIDLMDRYWGQFILTYGPGQSRFIDHRPRYDGGNARPITVGSARNDAVRRRHPSTVVRSIQKRIAGKGDGPIVLYVPGMFVSNNYRFESNDFRDIRCFEVRRQIAAVFDRHPEIRFVYKSFVSQGHDPTLEMLSAVSPRHIVIGNVPLTDLQWAADALIHEIPSSGMVEGLLTEKPMIVLANRDVYRVSSEAQSMLRKRVTLAETGDEFVRSVECMLAEARFAPVVDPDQEFLRTYVTHLNDGASATRAADVIYALASATDPSIQPIGLH